MLGFLEQVQNSIVTRPEYTPSKVGGQPAYIWPEGTPAPVCAACGFKLSFLMQLYANINDDEMDDFHRMLYVFLCVSEKCINTQNAVKVYRCIVPHENEKINFDEDTFYEIQHKTDNQLRAMGWKIAPKAEEKKHDVFQQLGGKFAQGAKN